LVVGAAGAASGLRISLLICLTSRKITKATMINSITVLTLVSAKLNVADGSD